MSKFDFEDAKRFGVHIQGHRGVYRYVKGVTRTSSPFIGVVFYKFVRGDHAVWLDDGGTGLGNITAVNLPPFKGWEITEGEEKRMVVENKTYKVTLIGGKQCGSIRYYARLRGLVEVVNRPRPDFNHALLFDRREPVPLNRETYHLVQFELDHVTHNVYIHSSVPTQQGVLKYLADHVQPKYRVGDRVWRATQFKGHEVAQVTCYVVHSVRVGVDGDNKPDYIYILRSLCVGSSLVVNSNDVYSDLQEVQQLGND